MLKLKPFRSFSPGIDNDIYSTVDACRMTCEIWKALKVEQSQELKTVSYHKLYDILKQHQNEVNEIRAERLAQPATITEDEEMSKEKEIDNLLAFFSLSFTKVYKKTANNNLRTSSNTSRANQDNSLRINRGTGYDNQRAVNVVGARENVGTLVVQKSGIQCYNCKEYGHVSRECQKPKRVKDAAYHKEEADFIQEVTLDPVDNSRPIFDDEPMHKVQNNNDNYNVFAMEDELLSNLNLKFRMERMITDDLDLRNLKKFQAELDKCNDVNYASKVEIDCAKAKGDLMSFVHIQETISHNVTAKQAQIKLYKTREDKELDKANLL
ncbi:retrovirus-related pol polyprotein from transposon TNT 1-94 [Tanacetum coccineum]